MGSANGTGMNLQHGTDHETVICDVLWSDKVDGNPCLRVLMMHILQHPVTCHNDSPDHNDGVCQMFEKVQTLLNPNNSCCEDPVRSWSNPPHLQDNEVVLGVLLHLHAAVASADVDNENDDHLALHGHHTVSYTYRPHCYLMHLQLSSGIYIHPVLMGF
jgi:hypothetical protein